MLRYRITLLGFWALLICVPALASREPASEQVSDLIRQSIQDFETLNQNAVDGMNDLNGNLMELPAVPESEAGEEPLQPPVITDTNGDGKPDHYEHPNGEVDEDTNHDGEIDKVTIDGTVVASDIDRDGDLDGEDYRLYLEQYYHSLQQLKLAYEIAKGDAAAEAKVRADMDKWTKDFENTVNAFHGLIWGIDIDTPNAELMERIREEMTELQNKIDLGLII